MIKPRSQRRALIMVNCRACTTILVVVITIFYFDTAWSESGRTEDSHAFIGARVIDGTGAAPIENATIIIRNGRFEAVGPSETIEVPDGATIIKVPGKTIVPGLVNAHGHISDVKGLESKPEHYTTDHLLEQLRLYARYGVTTVFSLGGDKEKAFKLSTLIHFSRNEPRKGGEIWNLFFELF